MKANSTFELKRPQLASSEIPDIFTQVTWPKIIQPKLDGICCLAVNGVALSRTMKPIPNKFIQAYFKEHNLHGFHGELMSAGCFNHIQSGVMSVEGEPNFYYVVYDKWDSEEKYSCRFDIIRSQVLGLNLPRVILIDSQTCNDSEICDVLLTETIEAGYEGAMLRDPDSFYKQGRHTLKSQALMKLKKFFDDEAVIVGFEEKMHNTNEQETDERGYSKRSHKKEGMVATNTLGALVVKWKNSHTLPTSVVEFKIGSGYTDTQRKQLWEQRSELIGKPVTFKYQELSKYGVPRFPVFKCIRMELR